MLDLGTYTLEHHAAKNRREVTQRTQTRKPHSVRDRPCPGWASTKRLHVFANGCLTERRPPRRDGPFRNYVNYLAA